MCEGGRERILALYLLLISIDVGRKYVQLDPIDKVGSGLPNMYKVESKDQVAAESTSRIRPILWKCISQARRAVSCQRQRLLRT